MKSPVVQRFVRIAIAILVFVLFATIFIPFFKAILMAALFAFALDRLVSRFAVKRSARFMPTFLVLVAFFLIIASPIALVAFRLTSSVRGLTQSGFANSAAYKSLHELAGKAESISHFVIRILKLPPESIAGPQDFIANAGTWLLTGLGTLAATAPELVMDLFIFSIALYFFLTEAKSIRKTVSSLKILTERELDQIILVIQRSSYFTLVVSAAVGAVQALIVALGGVFFGYYEFLLLFAITFFTSFIPVIGAAPVAILLALFSLIQGEVGAAMGLGVVALVAGSIDNLLKPYLVSSGSEESLNPVVSLLAIIGAVIVYGLPGLLLGPVLMELAIKIIPILFGDEEEVNGA